MATATKTKEKKDSSSGGKTASGETKSGARATADSRKETGNGSLRRTTGSQSGSGSEERSGSDKTGNVSVREFEKELGAGSDYGRFFGEMFAFNNSLKLYHWHVSGSGSYAAHMAIDQAIASLAPILDRIVETTYSMEGDIDIVIPQTQTPSDIEGHCQDFYDYIDECMDMFEEDFTTSILEDYQEAVQQLLYRLRRLR